MFLSIIRSANAQHIFDAYSMSTASADLCSSTGIFISKNPAGIVDIDYSSIQASQVLHFSIALLSTNSLSIKSKFKNKGYAIEYSQAGLQNFKINLISFTTGLKLSKNSSFGVKIINRILPTDEQEIQSVFSVELGAIQQISSQLKSALHLKYNANSNLTSTTKSTLGMGLSYLIDPKFVSYVAIEMNEDGLFTGRAAVAFTMSKHMSTSLGWSSSETNLGGGIRYSINKIDFEMSTSYHNNLGMSYGAGLCYKWDATKHN